MPVPSSPLGMRVFGNSDARITIEVYIDLNCPFSCKMLGVLRDLPDKLKSDVPNASVSCILHAVPQPWHPQSCLQNEALLAVSSEAPQKVMDFISVMCANKDDFTDAATWEKSRAEIVDRLATLAEESGVDKAAILAAMKPQEGGSTKTTQAVKFAVKFHRTLGVHVTPTVFVNRLENRDVSSSWSIDDWIKMIKELSA